MKCKYILRGMNADDTFKDHKGVVQGKNIEEINHLVIEEALRLRNTYHYDRIKYLSLIKEK